jgi:hypothetical protein
MKYAGFIIVGLGLAMMSYPLTAIMGSVAGREGEALAVGFTLCALCFGIAALIASMRAK